MMNLKGRRRKWSLHNFRYYSFSEFAWMEEGKTRKTSVRTDDIRANFKPGTS
jgi:hypothetical protein